MSIFDQMKNRAETAARSAVSNPGNKCETFTFQALPESVEQMRALPEATMDTPFKTAVPTAPALSNCGRRVTGSGAFGSSIC